MSRHRRLHSKPSRTTICAAAGTAAAASVAAAVIAAGPMLFQPAAASGAGSPGASSGLALAVGRVADQQRAQRPAAVTGPAHPENPALAARQALNKRYAQAVAARKRATAARLAAERARKAAQRRAAAQHQAAGSGAQPAGSPQQIALAMLPSFGWSSSEFNCLNPLWQQESGWNPYASNPSSGAYGIPQALPGSKMASAGPDWQSNAATQIRWGLDYIRATYGSPCSAWSHEQATGWY